jgi:hypothetical protein
MCFASVYGAVSGVHCGTASGEVCYVWRTDTQRNIKFCSYISTFLHFYLPFILKIMQIF